MYTGCTAPPEPFARCLWRMTSDKPHCVVKLPKHAVKRVLRFGTLLQGLMWLRCRARTTR